VIAVLVGGLLAGYGIAIPVGAVGSYLVALTARTTPRIGVAAALGVATADGGYALAAVVGGDALAQVIEPAAGVLRLVSTVLLVGIGLLGWLRAIRAHRRPTGSAVSVTTGSAWRAYLGLLGITLVNPTTVVYFTALVVGGHGTVNGVPPGDPVADGVFVLAAFSASASWQLLLAGGGVLLGRVLTGPTGRLVTGLVSGAVIIALGPRLGLARS
jgi:arginine exporter protein ArgO